MQLITSNTSSAATYLWDLCSVERTQTSLPTLCVLTPRFRERFENDVQNVRRSNGTSAKAVIKKSKNTLVMPVVDVSRSSRPWPFCSFLFVAVVLIEELTNFLEVVIFVDAAENNVTRQSRWRYRSLIIYCRRGAFPSFGLKYSKWGNSIKCLDANWGLKLMSHNADLDKLTNCPGSYQLRLFYTPAGRTQRYEKTFGVVGKRTEKVFEQIWSNRPKSSVVIHFYMGMSVTKDFVNAETLNDFDAVFMLLFQGNTAKLNFC